MDLDVNHFKNKLADYNFLVYKIAKIDDLILQIDVKRGVHAVQYDKEYTQGSQDQLMIELNKHDIRERRISLKIDREKYSQRLDQIEEFIKFTTFGETIKKIHCTGTSTYEREALRCHCHPKTLKRIVNREIKRYLNEKEKVTI